MQLLTTKLSLGSKEFEAVELTVGQVRALFDAPKSAIELDGITALMLTEQMRELGAFDLIAMVPGLTVEDLLASTAGQLNAAVASLKLLNPHFFALAARLKVFAEEAAKTPNPATLPASATTP